MNNKHFVIVFVFLAIFIEGKDFEYCRIIKLRGGSIFVVLMGNPLPSHKYTSFTFTTNENYKEFVSY